MSILNNKTFRDIFSQFVVISLLVFFLWYIMTNLMHNIDARGITTGFDFLSTRAGFDISESPIAYNLDSTYLDVFVVGLINTIYVSIVGIFFATIIGLVVGIGRLSKNYLVSKLALSYIELFRNIPILLQILFWYNVVLAALPSPRQSLELGLDVVINNRGLSVPKPIYEDAFIFVGIAFIVAIIFVIYLSKKMKQKFEQTGKDTFMLPWNILIITALPFIVYLLAGSPISFDIPVLKGFNYTGGMTYSPEFLALTFALSIYTATYIAEAIRSGIQAVPQGQKEAASALGLSPYKSLKLVVLPQAIRISIPPIINQYLNLIKNSSLATAIGYPELVTVFSGTALNQIGQAIEIILMTMAVYLFLSLLVSMLLNVVNKKMEIKGR